MSPLTTEKRSYVEIGYSSRQSPPPTEIRNCLAESECFPATEEEERFVGKGLDKLSDEERYPKVNGRFVAEDFYEMPVYIQEGYLKCREGFGDRWEENRMYAPYVADSDSDDDIGNIGSILMSEPEDYGEKDYPNFRPLLNFRENPEFYNVLKGLAEKVVAYFNDNNNQKLCFEDIERVALCQSCRDHYVLTVKAIDTQPLDDTCVMFLRSMVVGYDGNVEVKVNNCEVVRL